MGRVERRRYRRRMTQAAAARTLLVLTAAVIVCGLISRTRGGSLQVDRLTAPTATPVASSFDETPVTRDLVLDEERWYAIQTGVYSTQEAADAHIAAYADRGAPGMSAACDGKYRVLIASFGEKNDAQSVRQRLSDRQNVETCLYEWVCEPVTLRLSGKAGQLDVAEAGMALPLQAARLLRDAATSLDEGGMTSQDVLDLTSSLDAQFITWADAARARFDRPYPPLVQGELALVSVWQETASAVRQAAREGATQLSGTLKCRAMQYYAQIIAMRGGLTDS